ncbi:MAG: hypothetical protein ABT940_14110, partial [Alphaproteobacteria bacterium]
MIENEPSSAQPESASPVGPTADREDEGIPLAPDDAKARISWPDLLAASPWTAARGESTEVPPRRRRQLQATLLTPEVNESNPWQSAASPPPPSLPRRLDAAEVDRRLSQARDAEQRLTVATSRLAEAEAKLAGVEASLAARSAAAFPSAGGLETDSRSLAAAAELERLQTALAQTRREADALAASRQTAQAEERELIGRVAALIAQRDALEAVISTLQDRVGELSAGGTT